MKKAILSVLIALVAVSVVSGQFYEAMDVEERRQLAESYYLVGERYEAVAATEKGEAFRRMAFNIYPMLEPDAIALAAVETPESVTVEKPSVPERPPLRQRVVDPRNAVRFQFSKLLRGFFNEDVDMMLPVLAPKVAVQGYEEGVNKEAVRVELERLFAGIDLEGVPPTGIYNLVTLAFAERNWQQRDYFEEIWEVSVEVDQDPMVDLNPYVIFWEPTQRFYFRQSGGEWRLFSVGMLPDPEYVELTAEDRIQQQFYRAFRAFLDGDERRVAALFSDQVEDLTSGERLTRRALTGVFRDYFASQDFPDVEPSEVLSPNDLYVREAERFGAMGERIYAVIPTFASREQRRQIPFFAVYSVFYVTFDEPSGTWRVFAIS